MSVNRSLIWSGALVAVLGALLLIFQATIFVIFGDWYSFSLLEILQHLRWHDSLITGVQGIDNGVDMALAVPLPVVLIVIGGLTALVGYRALQDEIKWSRRD